MAHTTSYETHDPAWWLERLQGVVATSSGWTARCPAHNDPKASLSISSAEDGSALVHCFAGCEYKAIISAVEDHIPISITQIQPAEQWWEQYTGVPAVSWSQWGVTFDANHVMFHWSETPIIKLRISGKKELAWLPALSAAPPLWPSVPKELPEMIFLTEGESDCGVLRFIGLTAFALTKGSRTPGLDRAFPILAARGVRRIVTTFDRDAAGAAGLDEIIKATNSSGIELIVADLGSIVDPLLGEKDIRDVWIRSRSPELIRSAVWPKISTRAKARLSRAELGDFLELAIPPAKWLVRDVLLKETVGMIAGSPKMGKSWLALDLAISIAAGIPFLNFFPVEESGPVVLVTKEDPNYLLQDRLQKIMISKGLGGHYEANTKIINLPTSRPPVYLDLTRSFVFDDAEAASLISWLEQIKEKHGSIALVIFDPILRMLSDVDEFKASEIGGSVFRISQRIQTEINCSCILVHHRAKGLNDEKGSYGSVAFHAFSDSTWYLKGNAPDKDGWVNVETEFKSAMAIEWAYRFPELDQRYVVQVSETPIAKSPGTPSTSSNDVADRIIDLLKAIPDGLTVTAITEAIPNASDFMVRNALRVLSSKGVVVSTRSEATTNGKRPDVWRLR